MGVPLSQSWADRYPLDEPAKHPDPGVRRGDRDHFRAAMLKVVCSELLDILGNWESGQEICARAQLRGCIHAIQDEIGIGGKPNDTRGVLESAATGAATREDTAVRRPGRAT